MKFTSTITVKIKTNKTIECWYKEQAQMAAKLFNECLELQMNLVSQGEKILSRYDLANNFRKFELGSDYKDKIYERIATSTEKWIKSESYRYKLYWHKKEKFVLVPNEERNKCLENYPFLKEIEAKIFRQNDFVNHIKSLSRKQILVGKPKYRKKCSLAFSIRSTRQNTIQILKNKIQIIVPKFKGHFSGKFNFLPSTSSHQFKLATLKHDNCGTLWLKLSFEENIQQKNQSKLPTTEKIIVGIDMGLKTTRTAVALNEVTKNIVDIFQPFRIRYFDKSYHALKQASQKDTRHLAFVHRKITRKRLDNVNKDIVKILSMGDEFKFGKPNAAFLFSGRLARSAADAANSLFLSRFAKRAELAGKNSGEVNESYTSVTCRKCLFKKSMPLKIRIYQCSNCGHEEDRDINSACQIAFREIIQFKKVVELKEKTACFSAVG